MISSLPTGNLRSCRADVHTVARPGSSQWISVEALNKITVLSSGEDGSLIYGGIAGFFDEFRYSKMGFKATLRNDKLTLRGIESSDGKEFLVVGSLLPPTVNVISHTREIRFQRPHEADGTNPEIGQAADQVNMEESC